MSYNSRMLCLTILYLFPCTLGALGNIGGRMVFVGLSQNKHQAHVDCNGGTRVTH